MSSIDSLKSEVATWSVDLTTRQVSRSDNHDRFYGYNENLPHWNIEAFLSHVHPDEASEFGKNFLTVGSREFDFEFTVLWADGSAHRLRSEGTIVKMPDGTVIVEGSTSLSGSRF